MKLRNLLFVFVGLVLFFSLDAVAQRDNTFYVRSFASRTVRTVGEMTTAAQAACDANTSVPCVIVFDPSLAVFGQGTMPSRCAQCTWLDYRTPGSVSFGAMQLGYYRVSDYGTLQAAIDAVYAKGGGRLLDDRSQSQITCGAGWTVKQGVDLQLAPLDYPVTSKVVHNTQSSMRGLIGGHKTNGWGTRIYACANITGNLYENDKLGLGLGGDGWHQAELEQVIFDGNGKVTGDCIKVENVDEVTSINRVIARGCSSWQFHVIGQNAGSGSWYNLEASVPAGALGAMYCETCTQNFTVYGLSSDTTPLLKIDAMASLAATLTGLKSEAGFAGATNTPVIVNCVSAGGGGCGSVHMVGGYLTGNGTTPAYALQFTGAATPRVNIDGMYIWGFATGGILDSVNSKTIPISDINKTDWKYGAQGGAVEVIGRGDLDIENGNSVVLRKADGTRKTFITTDASDNTYQRMVGTHLYQQDASGTTLMDWTAGTSVPAVHFYMPSKDITAGSFTFGTTGTKILGHWSGTATLDFAAITAPNCAADLTITVTGAAAGDTVDLAVPTAAVTAGVQYHAWVSGSNTVTVRACAFTGSPNPASGVFRADVWHH